MEFMKRVAVLLAMNPDASEQSIMDALSGKMELAKQAGEYKAERDTLAVAVKAASEASIIALVDANVDKKFTADKRDQLITLGKTSGLETLKSVIDLMPVAVKVKDVITLSNNGGEAKIEKFEDLLTLGREELEKFRNENRPEYVRLFKLHYGREPQFE